MKLEEEAMEWDEVLLPRILPAGSRRMTWTAGVGWAGEG